MQLETARSWSRVFVGLRHAESVRQAPLFVASLCGRASVIERAKWENWASWAAPNCATGGGGGVPLRLGGELDTLFWARDWQK